MKGHANAVMVDRLAVRQRVEIDIRAEASPQDALARTRGEVVSAAPTRMVAMAVRDHGTIDGPPRVQVKIARRTIKPLGSRDDEIHDLVRVGGMACDSSRILVESRVFHRRQQNPWRAARNMSVFCVRRSKSTRALGPPNSRRPSPRMGAVQWRRIGIRGLRNEGGW